MRWLEYKETEKGLKIWNSAMGEVFTLAGLEGGALGLWINEKLYSLDAVYRALRMAGEAALQEEELPDNMAAGTD